MTVTSTASTTVSLRTTGCQDEPNWSDSNQATCSVYVIEEWCTISGAPGVSWDESNWGPLAQYASDGIDATYACCGCGRGASGCWEANKRVSRCDGYESAGYTCVGYYCAVIDPGGDPSQCAVRKGLVEDGWRVDSATGRCGLVGPWTEGPCSVTCGEGTLMATRPVLLPEGQPPITERRPCVLQPCPVDCQVGGWIVHGGCWARGMCGVGTQNATRDVVTAAAHGGEACPPLWEVRGCNLAPCCTDVAGWLDTAGNGCPAYVDPGWCTSSGEPGVSWPSGSGPFSLYAREGLDATQACCGCGGGSLSSAPPPTGSGWCVALPDSAAPVLSPLPDCAWLPSRTSACSSISAFAEHAHGPAVPPLPAHALPLAGLPSRVEALFTQSRARATTRRAEACADPAVAALVAMEGQAGDAWWGGDVRWSLTYSVEAGAVGWRGRWAAVDWGASVLFGDPALQLTTAELTLQHQRGQTTVAAASPPPLLYP